MSMCISIAQARTKCGSWSRDPPEARHFPSGAEHFPCKFSHKKARGLCPSAFWLRRCGPRSSDPFSTSTSSSSTSWSSSSCNIMILHIHIFTLDIIILNIVILLIFCNIIILYLIILTIIILNVLVGNIIILLLILIIIKASISTLSYIILSHAHTHTHALFGDVYWGAIGFVKLKIACVVCWHLRLAHRTLPVIWAAASAASALKRPSWGAKGRCQGLWCAWLSPSADTSCPWKSSACHSWMPDMARSCCPEAGGAMDWRLWGCNLCIPPAFKVCHVVPHNLCKWQSNTIVHGMLRAWFSSCMCTPGFKNKEYHWSLNQVSRHCFVFEQAYIQVSRSNLIKQSTTKQNFFGWWMRYPWKWRCRRTLATALIRTCGEVRCSRHRPAAVERQVF